MKSTDNAVVKKAKQNETKQNKNKKKKRPAKRFCSCYTSVEVPPLKISDMSWSLTTYVIRFGLS